MLRNPLESNVERHLFNRVRKLGGRALKLHRAPGWPDRLVLLPGTRAYLVEMKRPKNGRLAEHQKLAHAMLDDLGFKVVTLWSKEEVDGWLSLVQKTSTIIKGDPLTVPSNTTAPFS